MRDHTDYLLLRIIYINSSSVCCQPQFTVSFLNIQNDIVIQQVTCIQMVTFLSLTCISIDSVGINRQPNISRRSQAYARDFFCRNKRDPFQLARRKMIPPQSVAAAGKQHNLLLFVIHTGMCKERNHFLRSIYRKKRNPVIGIRIPESSSRPEE